MKVIDRKKIEVQQIGDTLGATDQLIGKTLAEVEVVLVSKIMHECNGILHDAAGILGIPLSKLNRKLKLYGKEGKLSIDPTSTIGYVTSKGLLYIGDNALNEKIYVMPTDIPSADKVTPYINVSQANEWLDNANSMKLFGYSDWDFPTGGDTKDELSLFYKAMENNLNDIFNFNPDGFYASKTSVDNRKTRYGQIYLKNGHLSSFNTKWIGGLFRALRRTMDPII